MKLRETGASGHVRRADVERTCAAWFSPFLELALKCLGSSDHAMGPVFLSRLLGACEPGATLERLLKAGWRVDDAGGASASGRGASASGRDASASGRDASGNGRDSSSSRAVWAPWVSPQAAAADGAATPLDAVHAAAAMRGERAFSEALAKAGAAPPAIVQNLTAGGFSETLRRRDDAAFRTRHAAWWASATPGRAARGGWTGGDGFERRAARGGWAGDAFDDGEPCDFDEVLAEDVLRDPATFVRSYVLRQRPVVIRGGAARSPYRKRFEKNELLKSHGETCWAAADIPHGGRSTNQSGQRRHRGRG